MAPVYYVLVPGVLVQCRVAADVLAGGVELVAGRGGGDAAEAVGGAVCGEGDGQQDGCEGEEGRLGEVHDCGGDVGLVIAGVWTTCEGNDLVRSLGEI